jgi:hypothetical protein
MTVGPQASTIHTRWLTEHDVPALLELERRQWQAHQAASAATLTQRIRLHPRLSVGAFCSQSGAALCSLFMRPIGDTQVAALRQGAAWHECEAASAHAAQQRRDLFGISLTSVDTRAVRDVMAFFYPYALRSGWRRIYLGSPMPGLTDALNREPGLKPADYAARHRGRLPLDPQLRYYHRHGFKTLVAVAPDYFPHADSLNHGAILMGRVPLSWLHPLWRTLPSALLGHSSRLLFKLL